MSHPLRSTLGLVIATLTGLTALIAPPAIAHTPSAEPPFRAAALTTVVTLKVARCNGCIVQPVWYPSASEYQDFWKGRAKTVRDGVVRFTVSRSHTVGLHFRIRDPRAVRTKGRPVVVIRYEGHRVGHDVTATQARTGTVGWHCWAGTTRAAATLRINVNRWASHDYYDGTPGYKIRAYADPTARWYDQGYPIALRSGIATTWSAGSCGR